MAPVLFRIAIIALSLCLGAERQASAGSFPLKVNSAGKTGFTSMLAQNTGVTFTNFIPEPRFRTNQILLNGSGVAAGDVDGDGYCDLYFARINGENTLYRNLGNWRFEDITAKAGVSCARMDSTGVALADLDGDGDLDLVVNSVGNGTRVFLNDGKAHFTELTPASPFNRGHGGMSMALGDINGDGFLDLYIANYRTLGLMDMPNTRFWLVKTNGQQVVSTVNGRSVNEPDLADRFAVTATGGIEEMGEPDLLLLSVGGTNFAPLSFDRGAFADEDGKPLARSPLDWGLTVLIRDINQDGLPDIYVCNDFDGPDRLWLNQGGGKFRAAPRLALRKLSFFSMGADVADINRDGFDDIFVADMLSRDHVRRMNFLPERKAHVPSVGELENRPQYARNTLFLNRGDGTYAEIANLAGAQASEWSWSPAFLDVDLDGWEDLLITNGHERDARNMDKLDEIKRLRATGRIKSNSDAFEIRKIFPKLATANIAFKNNRDLTFEELGKHWGFDFEGVSQGIAFADLDNDGDLDVVINNLNAPALLLRNDSIAPRIAVRLKGAAPNTAGTGARIIVSGGPVRQEQEMMSGGRYLSSDQPLRVFAAGAATNKLSITVNWRSGRVSVMPAEANQLYEVEEPLNAPATPFHRRAEPQPLFRDVSELLHHSHQDEPFDDMSVQPLLPRKLSQLGPGVTWHDVNGDGWEEAIIGSGKGGTLAVFSNMQGRFIRSQEPMFNNPAQQDQTAMLPWPKGPGHVALMVGATSWEQPNTNESCAAEYDLHTKMILNRLPGSTSSTGPLALADIDGDGDLDLFVGGRAVPGRYPSASASLVFRNVGGRWELDATNTAALATAGMVSGAVFSDVNGDGAPDLVLACDWGPVRLFTNTAGILHEATKTAGLEAYSGWWNGVATGDFDGDGRLDIVASNWGRNTPYEPYRSSPLKLYFGDFSGDGSQQIIEAHYESSLNKTVPNRGMDTLAKVMPGIRGKFATYDAYAHAGVDEIVGEAWSQAKELQANWLDTTLFLNRATGFVARPLPMLAQASPAFGVCVADADGDGKEDIFLAQNFFATHVDFPRCDAGIGLWLMGDGHGNFKEAEAPRSGVKVYGEQRGAAVADYDHDGRVDLLVSQNGRETKLFHNEAGKPGLRIKVAGPPLNPNGAGTILRLKHGADIGPAREAQCGSGYWSCNSPVQVLGPLEGATEVEAYWPGGAKSVFPVPPGAREITISHTASVK